VGNMRKKYFHSMNKSFTEFPVLITDRLRLRKLAHEDAAQVFLLRSDDSVNRYLDRPKAHSIEDAVLFIQKICGFIDNGQSFYWAIELKEDSKFLGSVTLFNFSEDHSSAEIGYEILPSFQGKGYMHEALQAVIAFAFETAGFTKIEAVTVPGNISSWRLLEKNNFSRDKKAEQQFEADGKPNDVITYSRVKPGS